VLRETDPQAGLTLWEALLPEQARIRPRSTCPGATAATPGASRSVATPGRSPASQAILRDPRSSFSASSYRSCTQEMSPSSR
jgi:hypothetical protein